MTSIASENVTNVEFHDIYMVGSLSHLAKDFNPKFTENLTELHVESLEFIDRSELYRNESDGRGMLRVFVSFGARWASEEAPGEAGDDVYDSELDQARVLATIEGDFVVEYLVSDDIDQDYVDDYVLQNCVSHASPYWRDYLLGQCAKLRLNTARLPKRIVAPPGVIKG